MLDVLDGVDKFATFNTPMAGEANMGKRFWAITLKRFALSAFIVFLCGIAYEYLTNNPDYRSPILAGIVASAIYFVATALTGLVNIVAGALYLWWFADSDLTAGIVEQLRDAKIPRPGPEHPKTHEYLAILADDELANPNDRVKAAVLHGGFATAMSGGLFRSLAVTRALDKAVLQYFQEAPER